MIPQCVQGHTERNDYQHNERQPLQYCSYENINTHIHTRRLRMRAWCTQPARPTSRRPGCLHRRRLWAATVARVHHRRRATTRRSECSTLAGTRAVASPCWRVRTAARWRCPPDSPANATTHATVIYSGIHTHSYIYLYMTVHPCTCTCMLDM